MLRLIGNSSPDTEHTKPAEKAALAIKKLHPQLQVTVYDAKEQRHTTIERPKVAADPRKKSPHRAGSTTSQRRAVAGGRR